MQGTTGVSGAVAQAFIENKLTPLIVIAALLLGLLAVVATPREEEPQIVVPMIDVSVGWPGASADEVERWITIPIERAVREIPGVEYVYSTSRPSGALIIVRFLVNWDPERALINVRDKVATAHSRAPAGAMPATLIPKSIDDVPILALTFSSTEHDPLALRRMVAEVEEIARQVPQVAGTSLIGGLPRELRVELDPTRLASSGLPVLAVLEALRQASFALPAGSIGIRAGETAIESGDFLRSSEDVSSVVVAAPAGKPIHVRDVATVIDGPREPSRYVLHCVAGKSAAPAVTLTVAKTTGANATEVADAVLARVEDEAGRLLPSDVDMTITRNYGETAKEKSDELIFHLLLATVSVVVLMALFLGLKDSLVVAVAVPVTLALTLLVYYLWGYTLNRVTLFALIFSIGILVDDAIVVVENIHRHLKMGKLPPLQAAVFAVDEVGNPTILATLTVIAAILPMAFVTGLMGPYMRPIPVGASFAMLISLLVALIVSPWLSYRLLRTGRSSDDQHSDSAEGLMSRVYRSIMRPLIGKSIYRWALLLVVLLLLAGSVALVPLKVVTVKMLPFDNKSEFQVIIDAPEGTTLEDTLGVAQEIAERLVLVPEVRDVQLYAGTSGPFNFNGLVRHYFLREGPHVADLQVNLHPKHDRARDSHEIAAATRPLVGAIAARHGVRAKVAEIPPGPPVLSTLVTEVYGPDRLAQRAVAQQVLDVFAHTDGVVDIDAYVEAPQPKRRFVVDRQKAALAGIQPAQAAASLRLAVSGLSAGNAHAAGEREPIPITVTLPRHLRTDMRALSELRMFSEHGVVIPLSELVAVRNEAEVPFLYRKNGRAVTYVIGDVAGAQESPAYAMLEMSERIGRIETPDGHLIQERFIDDPGAGDDAAVVWDGEWRITYEVFRDLGIAFGAVLILIYVLVVGWFRSFLTPLIIMAPIPLTLVGILPGHAFTGLFFTATSMIGMIALAGIIVRNSILLVDFIELSLERGMDLETAVLEAGAVRLRPIVLTAAAVIVGAAVIILDPIFQGLAVALITGVVASTALTLIVIPLLYYVAMARRLERQPLRPAASD